MDRIKKLIEGLTYSEREKRKVKKYTEKVQRYMNMTSDELEMNYIEILTTYEHRKSILLTILGAILLSIIMDMWKYFFKVVNNLVLIIYENTGDAEATAKASLMATCTISVAIFIIIVFIVLDLLRGMKKAISEKIFIENFMQQRTKGEDK